MLLLHLAKPWVLQSMEGGREKPWNDSIAEDNADMEGMMNSICDWLTFTMECVDDFDGKLPTLDLNIWVRDDNMVMYIFYQKPMASSMVIQKRAAMPENMRMATLNQEVIRRMLNTSERLETECSG